MENNCNSWPRGVFKNLDYPEIPVHEILRSSARRWPDRNAIIFSGMEITYAELDNLSDRFAAALEQMGVVKGSRVAIHLPNCPQYAIAYFGLLKAGAVFVPLNPPLGEREFTYLLNDSGVETYIGLDLLYAMPMQTLPWTTVKNVILVSLADCYPPVAAPVKMLKRQPMPEWVLDMTSLLNSYPPEPPEVYIKPRKDLAHISYTDGIPGKSKGVMITHFNLVANCAQFCHWLTGGNVTYEGGVLGIDRMDDDTEEEHVIVPGREIALVVIPWYHSMGNVSFLTGALYTGATIVAFSRFDPGEFLRAIPKFQATYFGGIPQLFPPLVKHPLFSKTDISEISLVLTGTALTNLDLKGNIPANMSGAFCNCYGQSEATSICTLSPVGHYECPPDSAGLPVSDTEVKIVDPDDCTKGLPTGQVGEICIKGPQIMRGYWKKPKETADVLTKDGWLKTGDLGRLDEHGYLFVLDRKDDVLIHEGYTIYPHELERVLNNHPEVQQSAVVGKQDEHCGEFPVAFVQLSSANNLTEQKLLEFANSRLSDRQKIKLLKIVDQLPISPLGKVLKYELRELAQTLQLQNA